MAWTHTTDAAELWRRTESWLGEHAVENAPLLAEVGHLLATDAAPDGLECGWWTDDGGAVGGAYVRAPRHNPLLTRMPRAALDELARETTRPPGLGVPGTVADDAKFLSYANGLPTTSAEIKKHAVPAGISCRFCERTDCNQRAAPSYKFAFRVDEYTKKDNFFSPLVSNDQLSEAAESESAAKKREKRALPVLEADIEA